MLDIIDGQLTRFSWSLTGRTANARNTWTSRTALLLRLDTGRAIGWGEAAPLPGFSRDDLAGCEAELTGVWNRLDPLDVKGNVEVQLARAVCVSGLVHPASKYCLEMALLDLFGKARDQPVWRLLRADTPVPVPIAALLREPEPAKLAIEARSAQQRGLVLGKIKVGGGSLEADVARVRAASACGLKLRLDANQSLPIAALHEWIDALGPFEPELLEEPVATNEWASVVPGRIAFAMDESLMHDGWRERVADAAGRRACSALVLKPMALGGFIASLEVARVAHAHGMSTYVTHLFDGPLAAAATAELALSLPTHVLACGLDAYGRINDWLEAPVKQIGETHVRPGTQTGLGVDEIASSIVARHPEVQAGHHGCR